MATQFQRLTLADLPQLVEHLAAWQRQAHAISSRPMVERLARRILGLGGAGFAWLVTVGDRPVGYVALAPRADGSGRVTRAEVAGCFLEPSLRGSPAERQVAEFLASLSRWLGVPVPAISLVHDSLEVPRFRTGDRSVHLPPDTRYRATA